MSVTGVGGAGAAAGAGSTVSNAKSKIEDVVTEFMDYMKETPAQRMQDAWLRAHGISKADFDAMNPQQKEAILRQMKQDIEQKIKQQAEDQAKKGGPVKLMNILE